jgi:hypothetical protein
MKRLLIGISLLLLLGILIVPFVFVWYHFHKQPISDQLANWGALGDYISPFISAINLIVVGYFSYRLFRLEEGRDNIMRPLLTFVPKVFEQVVFWNTIEVSNKGKSVALNIRFKVFVHEKGQEHHLPLVGEGETQSIYIETSKWGRCEITYEDLLGKSFTTSITNPNVIPQLTQEEMNVLFPEGLRKVWYDIKDFLKSKSPRS